jgi:hypothetical protein
MGTQTRRIKKLKIALLAARRRKDNDEIMRLDDLIDRLEKGYIEPSSPLHTYHHRQENTKSINDDGCVEKA